MTRFRLADLAACVTRILEAVDVRPDHAAITAKCLVEADVRGRTGHGVIRVGPYVQRIQAGGMNVAANITVQRETPTSALIDGDNGLGQVVVTRATELAIAKASEMGMAWVGTVNSNHAGAAGLYPLMAAEQGMIGIYMAVANANGMPPWGGNNPLLGTNPIAIAVPAGDASPFLLDIATTVASHGTIKVVAQAGEQMPEGWVIDAAGNPITDPARAQEGFLMPIGGYKGAGLNIAIGLMAGVINGAAFGSSVIDHRVQTDMATNTGQSMFAMRSDLFMDGVDTNRAVANKLDELRNSGSESGDAVRLPGDRSAQMQAEAEELGVEVADPVLSTLNELATGLGVAGLT